MQDDLERILQELQRARFTERRTEPRQPCARPVSVVVGRKEPLDGFTKDLSRQGVGIIMRTRLDVGTVADLMIHSTQGPAIRLRGELRWVDAYGKDWFLTGWKFS